MSCQGWWLFSIAVILFHLRSTFFFFYLAQVLAIPNCFTYCCQTFGPFSESIPMHEPVIWCGLLTACWRQNTSPGPVLPTEKRAAPVAGGSCLGLSVLAAVGVGTLCLYSRLVGCKASADLPHRC